MTGRIWMSFAEDLAERYPESARIFQEMAEEEKGHRHMLLEMFEQRFGPNLPPIRRDNVKGFLRRRHDLADQEPVAGRHPQGSRDHGARGRAVLRQAAEHAQDVGVCASCSAILPRRKRTASISHPD